MALSPGDKLGSYEIVALIGSGGMGEVYRAHDRRLGRDVAIKVGSEQFSERFDREARAVAALNHANICHLYDIGSNYLAMELVEGENLQGPLPLETALDYARQIALALEEAHEKGIVHRDLKPANIKVRPDGAIKILDFGLAKVIPASNTDAQNSPTISMAATQAGVILGTAAYMAPEQARGKTVDRRADIWAFGVVLYEMLTGKRLFEGEDVTETLALVVMKEPDLSGVPLQVRRLLKLCLEKDPRRRLQAIGDWRHLLEEAVKVVPTPLQPHSSISLAWLLVAVLGIALATVGFLYFREPPQAIPEAIRFEIEAPQGTRFANSVMLAPDGRKIAFLVSPRGGATKDNRLWIRRLDSNEAHPIDGTEGAGSEFFWAPDSRSVLFSSANKLRRISIDGGPSQSITDLTAVGGGFFTKDNRIILGTPSTLGIVQVSVSGGTTSPVTAFKPGGQETYHAFPWPLPDGNHFLFRRAAGRESGVYIGALDARPEDQTSKQLLTDPSAAIYVPSLSRDGTGYVLYVRESTLLAQPFDASKLDLAGEAVPIADNLVNAYGFSATSNGAVAYLQGTAARIRQLTWYDRQGNVLGTVGDPLGYANASLSPDGTLVAVERFEPGSNSDIWVIDTLRGSSIKWTSDAGSDSFPLWSWDGSLIAFASNREGTQNLYQKKLSSANGTDELLFKSGDRKLPADWSRDGSNLLFRLRGTAGDELWLLTVSSAKTASERKAIPLLRGRFSISSAKFSPDSRWIAYDSNESGRREVYVRPFDPSTLETFSSSSPVPISNGVGTAPYWSRDGKELRYVADGRVMSARVQTSPSFHVETPTVISPSINADAIRVGSTPDAQRFLVGVTVGEGEQRLISVILNWQSLLKK